MKHSGKYIYVLIQKTKLLRYIARDALNLIPVMCDISSYELLCVDHDWTSRFCFSVPMSTLYINLWWMQNLTMHINGCVWWLLMFFYNWRFLLGIFCFVLYVILIFSYTIQILISRLVLVLYLEFDLNVLNTYVRTFLCQWFYIPILNLPNRTFEQEGVTCCFCELLLFPFHKEYRHQVQFMLNWFR